MTLASILLVGIVLAIYFSIGGTLLIDPYQYLSEHALMIKNIKEKFVEIANLSRDCEEFKYNVEEFGKLLEQFRKQGLYINISLNFSPCQEPFLFPEFPRVCEAEVFFSDGKVFYTDIIIFGWRPTYEHSQI